MHRRHGSAGRVQHDFRPRSDGTFRLAETDTGLVWLCVGEYRGPGTVNAFVAYCAARLDREMKEKAYRVYVTDSLKAIIGANSRYMDWVSLKPVDNRTGAEIAAEVIKKAGLKVTK